MYYIISFFFLLSLLNFATPVPSPFPIKLQLSNITEKVYPGYCRFENKHLLLTNGGVYEILKSPTYEFSLTPESTYFPDFYVESQYNNYTIIENGKTTIYVFSYINQKIIVKSVTDSIMTEFEYKVTNARVGFRVDEYLNNDNHLSISYFDNTGTARFHLYDIINNASLVELQSLTDWTNTGRLSCKHFYPVNNGYCFFVNTTSRIYYSKIHYEENNNKFNPPGVFATLTGTSFATVKVDSIKESKGVGVAYDTNEDILYFFILRANDPIEYVAHYKSDITNKDVNAVEIMMIEDELLVVTAYDGMQVRCLFYDFNFKKISFDGKEICGFSEFRASLTDHSKYINFVYTMNDDNSFVYFIQHQVLSCVNKTFTSRTDTSIEFDVLSLIRQEEVEFLNEDTGIYFSKKDDSEAIGKLVEIDRSGEVNENLIYLNREYFYNRFRYTPHKVGTEGYDYVIYATVTDSFYIPSAKCSFYLENLCYETCARCDSVGNENEHRCNECKVNFHFFDDTTNCINETPLGYYLNEDEGRYRPCPFHCEQCNNVQCLQCESGFVYKSVYSLIDSDNECVEQCDDANDKFYFDKNDDTFVCLKDTDECPYEYSKFDEERRQCTAEFSFEEMFEYLKSDVRRFYEEKTFYENEEYTALVYDSVDMQNVIDSNLTLIELGKCAEILNIDDAYIVIQIEKKENLKSITDRIKFSFYSKTGEVIDISKCSNTTIFFSSPINSDDNAKVTIDTFKKLSNIGINIYSVNEPFFYDKCSRFTSLHNGNDVLIKDRIKFYFPSIKFCDDGCTPIDFIFDESYVKCECNVSPSNVSGDFVAFANEKKFKFQHVKIITCADTLFNGDNIKKNISFFCMLILFLLQIANFVCYMSFKTKIFEEILIKKEEQLQSQMNLKTDSIIKNIIVNDDDKVIIARRNINDVTNNNSKSNDILAQNKNELVLLNQSNNKNNSVEQSNVIQFENGKKKQTKKEKKSIDDMTYEEYKENQMNFIPLFVLRIKQYNPIYVFVIEKDKDKIIFLYYGAFILELQNFFFWNSLLYFDTYISKNFYNGYKFYRELGSNFLSTIFSMLIVFIAKFLIRKLPKKDEKEKEKKIIHIEKMNYIFFSIILVLSLFFWYYTSVFAAVFYNTQVYVLYGVLVSIVFYFIMLIIVAVITVLVRTLAVKFDIKTIFTINKYTELY